MIFFFYLENCVQMSQTAVRYTHFLVTAHLFAYETPGKAVGDLLNGFWLVVEHFMLELENHLVRLPSI
jgi:hypothetical protein